MHARARMQRTLGEDAALGCPRQISRQNAECRRPSKHLTINANGDFVLLTTLEVLMCAQVLTRLNLVQFRSRMLVAFEVVDLLVDIISIVPRWAHD